MNFVYALLVKNLDKKEREEFDATLNSGVSEEAWAHQSARAFDRLAAGEFDRGTDLGGQPAQQDDGGV